MVEAAEPDEQVPSVPVTKNKLPFGFLKEEAGGISESLLFNSEQEFEDFTRL